jgi:hypothetical protein
MASTYKVLGQTSASSTILTITNYIGAGTTTVTGTVASTSGYAIGDVIIIAGATGTEQVKLNGTWVIASIPTGTTFTFVVVSSVTAGTLTTALGTTTKSALLSLYTVPAVTSTVCSTLVICNQGVSTNYRIAVRPAGATIAKQHYLVYDNSVNQYDSVFLTLGISLAATDVISIVAGTSNVSFSLFGSELT